jgi:hypothetical protein
LPTGPGLRRIGAQGGSGRAYRLALGMERLMSQSPNEPDLEQMWRDTQAMMRPRPHHSPDRPRPSRHRVRRVIRAVAKGIGKVADWFTVRILEGFFRALRP